MRRLSTVTKIAVMAICAVSLIGASDANAQQKKKWFFGLGTGFTFMNAEGDQGLHTALFGPVQAKIDLDPSDFRDLMETGFGLGGYATDGTWLIKGAFGFVKLGGEPSGSLPAGVGGGTYTSDFFFKITFGELTAGYTAYRSMNKKFSFTPYAGFRYMKHELGSDLSITQGATTTALSRNLDNNWADFLIGSSIGYVLSPKWTWSAGADAGFGGSEGTYSFNTAVTWKVKHFSFSTNFKYAAIEFVNGAKGDADWYLYDANEFGAGIGILYHF